MKRFESQVHTVAQSQTGDAIAKAHAQAQLAEAANRTAISLQALKRAKAARMGHRGGARIVLALLLFNEGVGVQDRPRPDR